jgi:hypothetical protein
VKLRTNRGRLAGLFVAVAALITLAAPALARADMVTQWNLYGNTALINTPTQTPPGAGMTPPVSGIHMAMVHGAVYDAVNAIDGGHAPYLTFSSGAKPSDSKEAAAATAAYRMLVSMVVPAQQAALTALYNSSLGTIPDGPAKTGGIAVGEAAAAAMLAARAGDGRFGAFRFPVPATPLPGQWKPVLPAFVNDPNAWVKDVKPFLVESSTQFATKGPHSLTSNQYAKEFDEVKVLGSLTSTERTADQSYATVYWSVDNPARTWARIARSLSESHGVSLVDNARLFAMLYMTAADSAITVWADKANWSFWRPITAIREAATDGNPATAPDPDWLPFIPTPPYPEHPSGHLSLSSSFAFTLKEFYGSNDVGWTDTNNNGLTRSYSHFSEAVDEIVGVRIWAGIHFRTADEQSVTIGKQVAHWRQNHFFQAVGDDD